MLFLTVLSVVLLHSVVGVKDDPNFIHQVMIVGADGGENNFCGGALISYDWAVTSVKCIEDLFHSFALVEAVAGFDPVSKEYGEKRQVLKYATHTKNDALYDIALAQVDKPFSPRADLKLARLPQRGEEICDTAVTISVFTEIEPDTKQRGAIAIALKKGAIKLGKYIFKKVKEAAKDAVKDYIKKKSTEIKNKVKVIITEKIPKVAKKFADGVKTVVNGVKKVVHKVKDKIRSGWRKFRGWFGRRRKRRSWMRRQKRDLKQGEEKEEELIFTGVLPRSHPKACSGSRGWPLFCGDTIWGIEADCDQSGARSDQQLTTYVDVQSDLQLISNAVGLNISVDETKGAVNWSKSGAAHFGWNVVGAQCLYLLWSLRNYL